MKEIKWLWGYLKDYRFKIILGLIIATVVVPINMVNPFIQGKVVDLITQQESMNKIYFLFIIMFLTTLTKSILRFVYQFMFEKVSQGTVYKIRRDIYDRVQSLDFHFFDKTKTGDIMARLTGDLEAVRHFSAWVIYMVYSNLLIFVTVIIIMVTINLKFTLTLLAIAPIIGLLTIALSKKVKPIFAATREQFSKLNSAVQENISGIRVVKAFATETHEIFKFSKRNDGFRDANLNAAKTWEKFLPLIDFFASLLSVTVILVGGTMVIKGSITLGELVTFNSFMWALNMPMRMVGWLVNDIQRFSASADKIMDILKIEPKISNPKNAVAIDKLSGVIEFKNVSFSYENVATLKNINFKVSPGQSIAIVGPTGSGKSTLISLIGRFYDCTEGEILVDGINIKELDLKSYRNQIGIAMQDVFLFSDTIEGNIAFGSPEIDLEKIENAAKNAGAKEFIESFKDGFDTIIGERGVGLSGGQRQRVALARALAKDPAILILDDTTSSIDLETEYEIQNSLKSVSNSKTTFIIAHRISSVKSADMILVIENGEVVERGTHDELINNKGYYYNIFMTQYGEFDKFDALEVV